MKSEHAFALIALILGVVGGVLLCKGAIDLIETLLEGRVRFGLESPLLVGVGVIAILAGVMIWTGRYLAGGVINMALGVLTVFYGRDAEGLLVLISGIMGIVAPKIKG